MIPITAHLPVAMAQQQLPVVRRVLQLPGHFRKRASGGAAMSWPASQSRSTIALRAGASRFSPDRRSALP